MKHSHIEKGAGPPKTVLHTLRATKRTGITPIALYQRRVWDWRWQVHVKSHKRTQLSKYTDASEKVKDLTVEKNDIVEMTSDLRQLVDTAYAPNFSTDVNGNANEWNNKTSEITRSLKKETYDKQLE